MKFLHIYAQAHEHGDAWIVGDTEGLTVLRDAINAALAEGSTSTAATTMDGEGFMLFVAKSDLKTAQDNEVEFPYTNALHTNALYHKKHPLVLIGPARYRELAKIAIELEP